MKKKKRSIIEDYEDSLEIYKNVQKDIIEQNTKTLRYFSFFGALIFAILTLVTLWQKDGKVYTILYASYSIFMISLNIDCHIIKNMTLVRNKILIYLFSFSLWAFGIILGTVISPEDVTVSFHVLNIIVPLIFVENQYSLSLAIITSDLLYIVLAYYTQTPEIFRINISNLIPFSALSILISNFIVRSKLKTITYEHEIRNTQAKEQKEKEQRAANNAFISDMIKFASHKGDPDAIINQCLEYICKKVDAERAYVFENNNDGTYSNTYEWCKEGINSVINDQKNLPYAGFLDSWIERYNNSKLVIYNVLEENQNIPDELLKHFNSKNIRKVITAPIVIEDKIVGFYGVDNPPQGVSENIEKIIDMLDYVISMLIKLRNDSRQMAYKATHDVLTDCLNRAALEWLYSIKYNQVAVIEYDLNGLKMINDTKGHQAGDMFIIETANVFKKIYGKENVYRTGGDEFCIIDTVSTKEQIEEKINETEALLKNNASYGYVYEENNLEDIETLMRRADKLMYESKNNYYIKNKIERRTH